MTILIGSDHIGYLLKQAVIEYCLSNDIQIKDIGPSTPDIPVDYPDFAREVCRRVASGEYEQGILICGTGIGMSIAANKHTGIRAALCHDPYTAHQARAHNDANLLCMGSWIVSSECVGWIMREWLDTGFEGGRHVSRLAKLERASEIWQPGIDRKTGPSAGKIRFSVALSPRQTSFGPLLFRGDLETGMAAAAKAGFEAVELSMREPMDLPPAALRNMLAQNGLYLSGVATGQSCIHDCLCLTSTDPAIQRATLERVKSLITWAAEFEAPLIIGGIRGRYPDLPAEREMAHQAALSIVRQCAQFAASQGTFLLLEAINRYETNFINTCQQGLAFIAETGAQNIQLLLDTFHMNIEEVSITQALQTAGDQLGYVHFADSNRWAPEFGHTDFANILNTLTVIGYQGVIGFEILPMPDDLSAIRQAGHFIESLRQVAAPSLGG